MRIAVSRAQEPLWRTIAREGQETISLPWRVGTKRGGFRRSGLSELRCEVLYAIFYRVPYLCDCTFWRARPRRDDGAGGHYTGGT